MIMLKNQYTYKYLAQAPGDSNTYGADNYGVSAYSCESTDQICLAGGPSAPNTGFMASSSPILLGGIFVTTALVIAVVVYAILLKIKRSKTVK